MGGSYIKNFNVGKRFTIKHFLAILYGLWVLKATIYQTLLRYEEGLGEIKENWNWSESWRQKSCPKLAQGKADRAKSETRALRTDFFFS